MKKTLSSILALIVFLTTFYIVPFNVLASTKTPYVVQQYVQAKNTSNCMSSYCLYSTSITIGFEDLKPARTYKIFRKDKNSDWKYIDEFYVDAEVDESYNWVDENGNHWNYDDWYEYTDNKLKSNTHYYYRLYDTKDKIYTKSVSYWTAIDHPSGVKKDGSYAKWKKVSGTKGYLVYYKKTTYNKYQDRYTTTYYLSKVSKKETSYKLPPKTKLIGVYCYTVHNDRYYLGWSGVHKTYGSMKTYIKDGLLTYVIKHKINTY